jgi:polyferredoxin
MNTKMWGLILSGAIVIAIGLILLIEYGYTFMSNPSAFYFTVGSTDIAGMFLLVLGSALILIGGLFKR